MSPSFTFLSLYTFALDSLTVYFKPLLKSSTQVFFDKMPESQKALLLTEKQGDLVVGEMEVYTLGKYELLIKVHATSLNPVNWKIKKYGHVVEKFPAVLGSDVAGEIEQVGEGVHEFKRGDRGYVNSA